MSRFVSKVFSLSNYFFLWIACAVLIFSHFMDFFNNNSISLTLYFAPTYFIKLVKGGLSEVINNHFVNT